MEVLKKKRTALRRVFSTHINKLKSDIESGVSEDLTSVQARMELASEKYFEIDQIDNRIMDLLLEKGTEEEISEELEKNQEYAFDFRNIKLKVNQLCSVDVVVGEAACQDEVSSVSSLTKAKKFKLPVLELKKFDGHIKDWLCFWGQFKKIDEDPDIPNEDKFQYLIQAMVVGSRAREVVESFPPSADNYRKAVDCLKARFGRDEVLVEYYVRELLKMTLSAQGSKSKGYVSSLYDKLETQLRSLETLGVTSDKYAAMLFPLVESCLPEDLLRTWQRCQSQGSGESDRLGNLMMFLKSEVEGEERILLAMEGFHLDSRRGGTRGQCTSATRVPSAVGLANLKAKCVFCANSHFSENCIKARDLKYEEKIEILRKHKLCFSCLRGNHSQNKCKTFLKCIICSGRHVPLMCKRSSTAVADDHEPTVDNNLSNLNYSRVFLKTLTVRLRGESGMLARVLIDEGSQHSYISTSLAVKMGLKPLRSESLSHALFGGSVSEVVVHKCYRVRVSNMDDTYRCNFEVLDQESICAGMPVMSEGPWLEELRKRGIKLSSPMDEGPVDILIGADIAGKLLTGRKVSLSSGLVALETYLGWTLMGKVKANPMNVDYASLAISMLCGGEGIKNLWELDILGIEEPVRRLVREESDQYAVDHFKNSVIVNDEGRYEVKLPWVEGHPDLPSNFLLANRRIEAVIKKLKITGSLDLYDGVLNEWLSEGVIEVVEEVEPDKGHYLPHRPVFKSNSTTKVRPVFDASAHVEGQPSLNQCLSTGINLIEIIPDLLLRFRLKRIGVISDIKKAFLQISVAKDDRQFLKFLWFSKNNQLKIFQHARVVFGVSCSPFHLAAVINLHLSRCLEACRSSDKPYSVPVIELLMKSFYVDNCVTSVDDFLFLENFIKEATDIFAEAKFELRGWEHTDSTLDCSTTTPVLGLYWDRKCDTLFVNIDALDGLCLNHVSRRKILSVAQRVFDPIGFCCPVSLYPKLLLQESWSSKQGWDDLVNDNMKRRFLSWIEELPLLSQIQIPRCLMSVEGDILSCSIHTFCDASKLSYACVAFLRVETLLGVSLRLVQAKSRVSPLKPLTIPRLELLAATIGARLANSIIKELHFANLEQFFWSDSSSVIAWIQNDEPWTVFVANRVNEIRCLTDKNAWHHLPGELNPADLPSRGCSAKALLLSKWWEGPQWLKLPKEYWPSGTSEIDEDSILQEKKKSAVALLCTSGDADWFYKFTTSYSKIIRVIARISRFFNACRYKKKCQDEELCLSELREAEVRVLKLVQGQSFRGVEDTRLSSLSPFCDNQGLIRRKTKVTERKDTYDFRMPIVLPSDHIVVEYLILYIHKIHCHVGVQGLMCVLREKYWILKSRKVIRSALKGCTICRRHDTKHLDVTTPPLPENRVRDAAVFEVTGIDYIGPLFLRDGGKAWICLFTCAVYRAVHLELVESLTTDDFLKALRRFISRRGRPSTIYSDNATNFVGAATLLSKLDWNGIRRFSSALEIDWKFSPPAAPWWGGWWERLVGILKRLLRKILGRTSLNYVELMTVLCDCEGVVNSRPLTYLSEDVSELCPLTPSMFLHDIREYGVPDCDQLDNSTLNRRHRYRQRIKEDLRKRFRSEYLGQLKLCRGKRSRDLQVGEIVLIGEERIKRIDWPMALVEEVMVSLV